MKAGRIIQVTTPWDGTTARIVISTSYMLRGDIKRLQAGRCFNGICSNGWTFLRASTRMGYIKSAYCWTCAEHKLLQDLLSGFDHGDFWLIQDGKLKKAGSWLSDVTDLVQRYRARVIKESQEKRPTRRAIRK